MFKASATIVMPTSIIGSLPRPAWYTAVLGSQTFLEAMMNARYREQYEDAVAVHLRSQETAGLDICTDGDAHFDEEVGGMSWGAIRRATWRVSIVGRNRRRIESAPPAFRAATSSTITRKRGSFRKSSDRSAAAICSIPRCGKSRSG